MYSEFSSVVLTEAIDTIDDCVMRPGDVGVICDITGNHLQYALEFFGLDGWTMTVGSALPSQLRAVEPNDVMHARHDKAAFTHRPSDEDWVQNQQAKADAKRGGPRVVLTSAVKSDADILMQPGDVGILTDAYSDDGAHAIAFIGVNHEIVSYGKAKPSQFRAVTPHDVIHARVMKESPAKVG